MMAAAMWLPCSGLQFEGTSMTRRRFALATTLIATGTLAGFGFSGEFVAKARKRKRRRGGGAAAFGEASVSGPNGRASAAVSCGPGTFQQTSPSQSSVSCRG
jgi:hypothetical protein